MKSIKRIILLVAAVMLVAGSANAKILTFGVKAGLNVNKLHLSKEALTDITNPNNSTGWEAGVMAECNVPIIGICLDAALMYARMNNSSDGNVVVGNQDFELNGRTAGKNFLMIPINLKYKFVLPVVSKYLAPYIFTGPNLAFKLDKDVFNDLKTKTCQVAWNIGLGVELVNHLQIGASYGFGINNIAEKVAGINSKDLNIKNNYWTVTAAWLF